MQEQRLYKLSFVLKNIEEFQWSDALFLPEDEVWNVDTEGLILDPNDVEDDSEEVPRVAKEKNLMYALSVQDVQNIVYNAKQQKEKAAVTELLEAYLYYYDNDAYIDWGLPTRCADITTHEMRKEYQKDE